MRWMGNDGVMLNDLPTGRMTSALRFAAAEAKLSQTKLADKVGMSFSTMQRRMSGDVGMTLEEAERIAEGLGYRLTFTMTPMDSVDSQ